MSISDRLREERKRLKQTQTELAELGGITKKAQVDYEKERLPQFADYLEAVARAGVDVQYVLTGERSDMALSPEERELLRLYRSASLPGKAAAIAALASGVQTAGARQSVTIGGDNTGNIVGESLTIREVKKKPRGGH